MCTMFLCGKTLVSRKNPPAAFAEADAAKAFAFAVAFHDDLVVVFEKAACFAGWQFDRFGASPA